jgi:MFS family permease
MGLGAVAGPLVGGFLVDADLFGLGWRAIFFVNLPVGIAAFAAGLFILPKPAAAARTPRTVTLDPIGMLLMSAAMVLVILPLVQGREAGWPAWTFVSMGAALPVFGLFVRWESRRRRSERSTLVEPSLFRNKAFTSALAVGTLFFATMIAFMLIVTVYLQFGLGRSAADAAIALIPWSVGTTVGAGLSGGLLAPRYGRKVLHAALLVQIAGLLAIWFTVDRSPSGVSGWGLTPAMALTGLGIGLFMAPFFDIAIAGVTAEETGSASGTINAMQQLAGALGIAVLGTLFFGYADDHMSRGPVAAFSHGIENSMLVMAGVLAATWVVAFLMPKRARDDAEAVH